MPDQPQQSSGFMGTLKSKLGPLPTWAWLAIITVVLLGYWLYEQHKQGAQAQQQPTPSSVGQPGVVVINQDEQGEPEGTSPPEPPEKKRKHGKGSTRKITVSQNETLGELAKQRHWSDATLQQVEEMNLTQGKGEWTPATKLTKGETVIRPLRS